MTFRKKRIAKIFVLFHGSALSSLENTSSEMKNFSEMSVFPTMSLILKKKKKSKQQLLGKENLD